MSEPTAMPDSSDRFTLLLPWYLLGTLQEAEQREVTAHVGGCERCRDDLSRLSRMREQLTAAYADQPPPSAQLKQAVFARIAAEAAPSSTRTATADAAAPGPMDRIERWFRWFFAPRWMPALAMVLLVGQLGLWSGASTTRRCPCRTGLKRSCRAASLRRPFACISRSIPGRRKRRCATPYKPCRAISSTAPRRMDGT